MPTLNHKNNMMFICQNMVHMTKIWYTNVTLKTLISATLFFATLIFANGDKNLKVFATLIFANA